MSQPKPYIGGQAVLEGVMMRAPGCMTIACRRPDGTIALREGPFTSKMGKGFGKWPLLRGVVTLVESMRIGFGAIQFSAEQQMTDEELEEGAMGKGIIVLSILIALGLFVALPQLLAAGSGRLFGIELGLSDPVFHALIGFFKLSVFTLYLLAVNRTKDMQRMWQYHGAEHKTIHAYEQKLPLTVDNVRPQTTLHPRCGTTFLVTVVIVSAALGFVAVPILLPNVPDDIWGQLQVLALRLALLPIIAGISFEFQRFSARYCTKGPLQVLLWPGFLFQKITTSEPDDEQIEIAIAALQAAEWRGTIGQEAPTGDEPLIFGDFAGFTEALPALRASQPTS